MRSRIQVYETAGGGLGGLGLHNLQVGWIWGLRVGARRQAPHVADWLMDEGHLVPE